MATSKPQSPGHKASSPSEDAEFVLRSYPVDSPQAAARVLVLALLADGSIDWSELSVLARRGTLHRLGISEAAFDEVMHGLCADLLVDRAAASGGYLVLGRKILSRILGDIGDPALQRKLLRGVLEIVHADGELAGGEAVLLSVAAECWEIDPFDTYRLLAKPARRNTRQP